MVALGACSQTLPREYGSKAAGADNDDPWRVRGLIEAGPKYGNPDSLLKFPLCHPEERMRHGICFMQLADSRQKQIPRFTRNDTGSGDPSLHSE
jgi:hypothetical protein